ncbi:Ankyrin repeat domain-containing protein 50 [Geodia barretti]|uniref:Ankyrin repeat domain-containing protein 50 n=1 Tax=Geodia barretti TaxID=519541 RepID=A0AA35U1L8_GEOBA|nr:Ankyrin repeat domain-containing protein 50 [Geodia barretti]
MVSKHQMDWRTATLEDVEKFRIQVCRELSLYDFSLNLVKVARGCVEVTWRVPRSLVTYIQNSVKPSSQSMMEHHVTTLTIDGFIVYDSSFAMQLEWKVIRLGLQAIDTNYSYLLEEMSPDEVVPHLDSYMFQRDSVTSLLKGEAVSHQQEEDEVMISGESSTQPSPPPPDSHLVTAQLEGSTLTRAQYNTIHSLTSSLLCIPTGDLVYDGHTLNPLTLHWHYCYWRVLENSCEWREIIILHLNEIGLLNAAYDGDIKSLDYALGAGVPVDCRISNGKSSLMYASLNGHAEVVDKLLQHGATVDLQKEDGWSSLMYTSLNGHVEVVDKLLQHGATNGWSSLMVASGNGHVEVVDKLLQHGATVDLQKENGWSSLMAASRNGHVEVVDKLLQHGATVDLQKEFGQTPLLLAVRKNNVAMVKELIWAGVDVNKLEQETGYTALMFACKCGHLDTVMVLMEHGADAKIRNVEEGITASDVASANEFWDLCAVIELMEPQATADIIEHPDTSLMKETVDEVVKSKFTTMVSKHQMDWRTATLEDVEKFRIQVCRELSLYDFSLNLVKVARGCVEVTWRVPRSLVTYIQNSVKPSSQSMMEHHVTTLTIDGFIVYDSSFAMQLEWKVIRLGLQAIDTNYSYLLEEMSPDEVVPHLVQRRLLTQPQGEEVWAKSSQLEKVHIIVEALRDADNIVVGMFPTFCMALANAGQLHVSERLRNSEFLKHYTYISQGPSFSEFQSLLKGEAVSHQQEEDEVMISGESSTQPSPPPPDSRLFTAQLEGSTLTRAQYNTIHSLTSSLLRIPTGDLVYDGHTLNPLTLHWHYYAFVDEGIRKILVNGEEIIILHLNEIGLLNAAWDGDKESLDCALGAGVPVDCQIIVSLVCKCESF